MKSMSCVAKLSCYSPGGIEDIVKRERHHCYPQAQELERVLRVQQRDGGREQLPLGAHHRYGIHVVDHCALVKVSDLATV